ncbi:uncharacterized protein LOC127241980 [Andrographis paniculata]|uniref:uncharacterized protein LOC127241980 n=1 Tax=Andrographis paniculata TaxID=175694 RepID=UPI0021E91C30|nr:uncharacterized protein LOC127241980 [Andrographis paniculata]
MSILPSLNNGSESSSSSALSASQFPPSNHGFVCSSDPLPPLQTSDCPSTAASNHSGQMAPGAQSVESLEEVRVNERGNNGKNSVNQGKKALDHEDATRVLVGSTKQTQKPHGYAGSTSNHKASVSSSSPASSGQSSWKKSQMVSGNHLLNFQYNPISVSRSQPRAPPPRRQPKRKPYNKDLFLQANYKFVVLDSRNYTAEFNDPDRSLCWEDIIFLKYSTPFSVQCPICLDDPLCPQITSCGHIFCFPCILQYFSIGEDDLRGESWKKCPLCFTMISSKDLYTIHIENVKQYRIGDEIEFILLTRQKDCFNSSVRKNENMNTETEISDSFSKFTLTSDVELSVREAMSDLDSWIARADSGLVDDIEKLPYVCAAMEQLENRKKYWNKRNSSSIKANAGSYGSPQSEYIAEVYGARESPFEEVSHSKDDESNLFGKPSLKKVVEEVFTPQVSGMNELLEDEDRSTSSSAPVKKDEALYNFFQAIDGQHIILHPLNMKCLLHHYGSYERLPDRISGKILQMETVTQSEATRRRYRFLSHFSLTTTFQLCEIDMGDLLPVESLSPFMDEIKSREKQRKRLARKEHNDKIKAEAANSQFAPVPYYSSYAATPSFSMDDFEALGSPPVVSSSPPAITERLSFSNVARLGFAAAHDSPALKTDEIKTTPRIDIPFDTANASGSNEGTSFADITSRVKDVQEPRTSKPNEGAGKKGKKPSRVLLSTAGGRRY